MPNIVAIGQAFAEIWRFTRGIQNVHRLTESITRYVYHILFLSFFNTVSCNWNSLGPAFLQSSDSFRRIVNLVLSASHLPCRHCIPLKIVPLHRGSGPPSKTWFLGPTRIHNPNSIFISSAVFNRAEDCDRPTDRHRQTDHTTASIVTIGCIYIAVRCGIIISCAIL